MTADRSRARSRRVLLSAPGSLTPPGLVTPLRLIADVAHQALYHVLHGDDPLPGIRRFAGGTHQGEPLTPMAKAVQSLVERHVGLDHVERTRRLHGQRLVPGLAGQCQHTPDVHEAPDCTVVVQQRDSRQAGGRHDQLNLADRVPAAGHHHVGPGDHHGGHGQPTEV